MSAYRGSLVLLALIIAILGTSLATVANEQTWRNRSSLEQKPSAESVQADVEEEIRFGREVAARLIGRYGLFSNDELTRYVTLVGQSLVRSSNRPELVYHFAILNTTEINAYAAPGGYIFVTKGAIEKMQDESELAGVIAHEMIHVNEKHVVSELGIRATDDSAVSGLARLIGGSSESARVAFNQAVDKALDMLIKSGYKREDEIRADRGAVARCAITGYDPSGLVRYFERIGTVKSKQTEVLDKTHPAYDTRIALIKDAIAKDGIESAGLKANKERFAAITRSH